jgi:hypothetical protein
MRGFPIASFAVVTCVLAGALVVPACSSDSADASNDAGIIDVVFPETCTTPIQIGAGDPTTNTYPGGACNASLANVACTYQAPESCPSEDVTLYTCTCDGTSWSCTITGDVEGGSCDMDATSDADALTDSGDDLDASNDASDASDGDAF